MCFGRQECAGHLILLKPTLQFDCYCRRFRAMKNWSCWVSASKWASVTNSGVGARQKPIFLVAIQGNCPISSLGADGQMRYWTAALPGRTNSRSLPYLMRAVVDSQKVTDELQPCSQAPSPALVLRTQLILSRPSHDPGAAPICAATTAASHTN
jgi:hypothetical protein